MGFLRTWEVFVNGASWAMILTLAAVKWFPGSGLMGYLWAAIGVASVAAGVSVSIRSIKKMRGPKPAGA